MHMGILNRLRIRRREIELEKIFAQALEIERRLETLSKRKSLSTSEQLEQTELKKQRLMIKDYLLAVSRAQGRQHHRIPRAQKGQRPLKRGKKVEERQRLLKVV